jgi:hypothetical protein
VRFSETEYGCRMASDQQYASTSFGQGSELLCDGSNSVKIRGSLSAFDLESRKSGLIAISRGVHMEVPMPATKVGVREFREQIARFLESDTSVAVTRRGETLGVYFPTPRKSVKSPT